jgi:hypothetical protein
MTFGKAAGLTVAFVGVFALGVVSGPRIMNRFDVAPDRTSTVSDNAPVPEPAESTPAPAPRARARVTPAPANEPARADVAAKREAPAIAASNPELEGRLKKVLRQGAKMDMAADGFASAEQFALVAHASHDADVPFMLLKHRVVDEGKTIEAAIRESKPDADAAAVVTQAREQARADVSAISANGN